MRFLIALALVPAALPAQQPITLTLQEAITMAQRNSPAAQVARSTRDAARWRDQAFNARLLPQVTLSGNAANLDRGINPITLPDGSVDFISQATNQSSLGLAVAQKIPLTGGTLSVTSNLSRIDLFGDQSKRTWQSTPVVIRLQQDLFRPRTLVWDEKVQSLGASVAEQQYLEAREDVAGQTAAAFFDLFAAQRSFENAASNAAFNDTVYTLNKGRYELGKIGENDLLKSELGLLRARAALDDARVTRDRGEAALRRTIALPEGQTFTIVTPDSIPVIDAAPDAAVKWALENSSQMEQSALDDLTARRRVTEARLNNRFSASINASYGLNQTASVIGDAYQRPLGKQQLQLGVNMPMIQWGAGRADLEVAKAGELQARANNKNRRDALAEDARFSVLDLQKAMRNVAIAAKADTVAAKQFEVTKNRYTIGKVTMLDLSLAQSDKDRAVIDRAQALRAYWTAYYHLRRVTLYDFATQKELADER